MYEIIYIQIVHSNSPNSENNEVSIVQLIRYAIRWYSITMGMWLSIMKIRNAWKEYYEQLLNEASYWINSWTTCSKTVFWKLWIDLLFLPQVWCLVKVIMCKNDQYQHQYTEMVSSVHLSARVIWGYELIYSYQLIYPYHYIFWHGVKWHEQPFYGTVLVASLPPKSVHVCCKFW